MMTKDDQLRATRGKLEELQARLAHMSHEKLARTEEMLCHTINGSAGTPCHHTCTLCAEEAQ